MGVVIDTSVLIAAEKGEFYYPNFLDSLGEQDVCISAMTVSELLHGVERAKGKIQHDKRASFVQSIIKDYPVAHFGLHEAEIHARLWAGLAAQGILIGAHDLIIAATAVSLDYSLVTINHDEFSRVPGLRLADISSYRRR